MLNPPYPYFWGVTNTPSFKEGNSAVNNLIRCFGVLLHPRAREKPLRHIAYLVRHLDDVIVTFKFLFHRETEGTGVTVTVADIPAILGF